MKNNKKLSLYAFKVHQGKGAISWADYYKSMGRIPVKFQSSSKEYQLCLECSKLFVSTTEYMDHYFNNECDEKFKPIETRDFIGMIESQGSKAGGGGGGGREAGGPSLVVPKTEPDAGMGQDLTLAPPGLAPPAAASLDRKLAPGSSSGAAAKKRRRV